MFGLLIISGLFILYTLMIKGIIKLNILSLFFITLLAFSINYIIETDNFKVNYTQMDCPEQIVDIWSNYSNHEIMSDFQLSRTLSPYHDDSSILEEPNYVVTDNLNIYSISGRKIVVTRVLDLDIVHEIKYDTVGFKPITLYITNDKLIVIGEVPVNKTRVYIYQLADFSLFKYFETEATYITSRLIKDELFLFSSRILVTRKEAKTRPSYIINGENRVVPYESIYYVNETYPNNFVNLIKTSINIYEDIEVMSYLGLGQVIYFLQDHIYIAEEVYSKDTGNSNKTILIKINNINLKLNGLQVIKGYVLDQYSLNEHNGYLRVATSSNEEDASKSSNHLFVLNEEMKVVGKLENFSAGNSIQAAVFIDDKAYIETFNILDPFYVIDLKDVRSPKIVSELKFEGYNTNFIPYDKNHILAFGVVLDNDKQAVGIKVSLYDVEDPQKVKIIAKDTILYKEYNSAYTDVLYDSKSLLLDKNHNVLGFPIVYWINEHGNSSSYYKQFYLIYEISPKNGLKRMGNISHYELGKFNNVDDDIRRGFVLKNRIMTISEKKIMENTLKELKLISEKSL